MVVLASGPELSLLRRCGWLEAAIEPPALRCRLPGRARATLGGGSHSGACGGRPERRICLEQDDAAPSGLTAAHAVCGQMRQTMMLATQRELQGVPWLLRCVAAETCALMCELGAGSVGVIRAVDAIVSRYHTAGADRTGWQA